MSKVLKLVASNVKRLTAIDITPDGVLTVIGGKNGAGKSSVLDAIAYAAGGSKLIPEEPIRKGETKAEIEVTLDNHIVVRKFTRDRLPCDCGTAAAIAHNAPGAVDDHHTDSCAVHRFGPTRSGLAVKTREGASYPSPQAVLDDLFGQLTFDPLAFFTMKPDVQRETLRRLVGLDTGEIDLKIREVYDKRTEVNRQAMQLSGQLKGMVFAEAPTEEISVDQLSKEMLEAERLRQAATDAERAYERADEEATRVKRLQQDATERIHELERLLVQAKSDHDRFAAQYETEYHNVLNLQAAAKVAKNAVPDSNNIKARLAEVDLTNQKVRANRQYKQVEATFHSRRNEVDKLTKDLDKLQAERKAQIEALKFPIDGLGIDDRGVIWNGIPLNQASTAEQLQISVAIGMALNPKVKVLLIRNGNALDEDSLALITRMANDNDYQIWLEWVTKSKDGVSVLIEDGHVAE